MRLGLERARTIVGYRVALGGRPAEAAVAAAHWHGAAVGRHGRRAARPGRARRPSSSPPPSPPPVADAYGLAPPAGPTRSSRSTTRCGTSPRRRPSTRRGRAGTPTKSLTMADGAAATPTSHRVGRMFVGLPQLGCRDVHDRRGRRVTVHQELRCPVGDAEPAPGLHVLATTVVLGLSVPAVPPGRSSSPLTRHCVKARRRARPRAARTTPRKRRRRPPSHALDLALEAALVAVAATTTSATRLRGVGRRPRRARRGRARAAWWPPGWSGAELPEPLAIELLRAKLPRLAPC